MDEDEMDSWYEEHKDILTKREIYAKLEWQVGKVKPNDSIFNYFIQMRQSGIRVKKAEYFPTLVAISQIPIYGKEKSFGIYKIVRYRRDAFQGRGFRNAFELLVFALTRSADGYNIRQIRSTRS